jgi:hypothetical protein
MKTKIAVAASVLLLTACTSIPCPKPAPIAGDGSAKAQVKQLDQGVREALGAQNKDDLIVRVGADGTITLFGAEGSGFKVEDVKEDAPPEKGVVSKVGITVTKNSPTCGSLVFDGKRYFYPVPDCPHLPRIP